MKIHRALFPLLFILLIFVSGCSGETPPPPSPTSAPVDTEIPTLVPPSETAGVVPTETPLDTATMAPVPSATAEPSSTPESTATAIQTDSLEATATETAFCQDDLAQVQEVLSGQWSLLNTAFSPQRAYYRSGVSDFVLTLVSSGNFAKQDFRLPNGDIAVVDTLTAYSVDNGNRLYAVDIAVGVQYPDQPYVLLLNRWSPLEAAITTLEGAQEILSRGRLFDISLVEFVAAGEIVHWDQCQAIDWYVAYFSAATCQLGQSISDNQPGWITTLIQGGRPLEGEVPFFFGWVIHLPTHETALEWGVLEMPTCP